MHIIKHLILIATIVVKWNAAESLPDHEVTHIIPRVFVPRFNSLPSSQKVIIFEAAVSVAQGVKRLADEDNLPEGSPEIPDLDDLVEDNSTSLLKAPEYFSSQMTPGFARLYKENPTQALALARQQIRNFNGDETPFTFLFLPARNEEVEDDDEGVKVPELTYLLDTWKSRVEDIKNKRKGKLLEVVATRTKSAVKVKATDILDWVIYGVLSDVPRTTSTARTATVRYTYVKITTTYGATLNVPALTTPIWVLKQVQEPTDGPGSSPGSRTTPPTKTGSSISSSTGGIIRGPTSTSNSAATSTNELTGLKLVFALAGGIGALMLGIV